MKQSVLAVLLIVLTFTISAAQPLPPPVRADDGSVIDVLVLYTQNARAVAGGTHPQTMTLINTAMSGVNSAFAAAGVLTQFNIVHYQPVFYLEQVNVDFHADLTNLTGTTDGYLDEIHALRDYYAADLVLMVAGTWFYIYTGDSMLSLTPDAANGFVVWEARGVDDSGGLFNAQWIARTLGVDDTPPYDSGQAATMNANLAAVANYRDSADRVVVPVELLHNGGFEIDMDGNKVPDFWAASGWAKGDARACGQPANVNSGLCSLKLKVAGSTGNTITQPVSAASIALNDDITLAGFLKTQGGGTCIKAVLVIKYMTMAKQKHPYAVCGSAPQLWELFSYSVPTSDHVTSITLKVKATSGGTVWLDDLSLSAAPASTRGGRR